MDQFLIVILIDVFFCETMPVFWLITLSLIFLYYLWIGYFYYGWLRIPSYLPATGTKERYVSIVIPVRNEEVNILTLLNNLISLDYPQNFLEIIIIDDHSTDLTPGIINDFIIRNDNIRYFKLASNEEGKKSAIRKGVTLSRYPIILTTDADCRPSRFWVKNMIDYFETSNSDLIAGPVLLEGKDVFFTWFQKLEFFSLLGSTAGAISVQNPIMCNSANLGFKRDAYLENSDSLLQNVTSGDDVFLLFSIHKNKNSKIRFLKSRDACVMTNVENKLDDFFRQRQRWASKSLHYKTKASVFTALLVFTIHFFAIICLLTGFILPHFLLIAAVIFILKSFIDFPFLYSVTSYFGEKRLMICFPVIQLIYFFYINYTAITSFTGVFKWKGRIVRY